MTNLDPPSRIPIANRSEYDVDEEVLRRVCGGVAGRFEGIPAELSLALVTDEAMTELNETYHGGNGPTDVLAFPYGDGSAEIVLNLDDQHRRARATGDSFGRVILDVLIHALLHLAGYDHTQEDDGGEHFRVQKELLREFVRGSSPWLH